MTDLPRASTIIDGRYKVISRVGSGGMADVLCAEDLQLGRKVAVKLLHRRFAQDAEFVERFRREASSAAGLQHPHVVAVYDRGEWDDTYYIAMEYLEGRTLKRVVLDEAPLEQGRAAALTTQILKAARFAHKRGIIHRDLKPHNVIVGADGRAKVTDFGIAKAGASDMTQTGSIMGTAHYLSPEQAQGHAVSAASDLYSVGIILYELLTGRVPFEGDSAVTIALKQVSEPPVPPSVHNPAVTPALEAVVLHALAKDPTRRFQDADAFIAALAAATEVDHGQPTGAFAALDATRVVAGPATASVPILPPPNPYATGSAPPVYPAPLEPAPVRDGDGGRWWAWLLGALLLVVIGVGAYVLLSRTHQVTVPSVVGRQEASAQTVLRREGFSSNSQPRASATVAKGTVIAQRPGGDTKADKHATVTLFVSSGPGTATIPQLRGLARSTAHAKLKALGFTYADDYRADTTITQNRVIETSPQAGTSGIAKGTEVRIVLSNGPQRIEMPDLRTLTQAAATQILTDNKLVPAIREQVTDNQDPGTVMAQSVAPSQPVAEGSTVTLTVAKAPTRADVPNVVGQSEADAAAALTAAGFASTPTDQPTTDQAQDGKVLAQSPTTGKRKKGTTVAITVGRYQAATTTTTTPPAATTPPATPTTAAPPP